MRSGHRQQIRQVAAFPARPNVALARGFDPTQLADRQCEPSAWVGLDYGWRGSSAVPNTGYGLHGAVRGNAHFNAVSRRTFGEGGQCQANRDSNCGRVRFGPHLPLLQAVRRSPAPVGHVQPNKAGNVAALAARNSANSTVKVASTLSSETANVVPMRSIARFR